MSKRILSLVLTLTLILGSFSMAFAAPSDVVGTPAEDAVERLGNLGILEGYTDGTFKPDNNITRAEFAAVVARATGLEKAAIKGQTAFGDVPASHWASGYVRVAEGAGLIKGMGKVNGVNTFAPEANISYEQAVTMVVRSLGYEPAAQDNGGYPTGYLIVASREGLLKDVKGVAGQLATRALVAQLVDNALEIPKMIAVAYDGKTKYVKSGAEGTAEQFLFNDLQLESIEGALEADSSKNKVTVTGVLAKDKNKTGSVTTTKSLKVSSKNFDYAGLDGMKVQAWFDKNDNLISVKLLSDYVAIYDAIEINTAKKKLTAVTADKDYDLALDSSKNVITTVKGEEGRYADLSTDAKYDFAKIVLNEYGDVKSLEVYNLGETILVNEIKGNDVKGYNGDEIVDAHKYTIIKDGKQVAFDLLKDKELVLYNAGEKYGAVVTNIKQGKIDRVYSNGDFKFEGKNYTNDDMQYLLDKDFANANDDVLEEMQENGEVKVFFNFKNEPVFISGDVKEVASSYVMVTADSVAFENRGKEYVTFDYMNAEGTKVKEEIEVKSNKVDKDIVKPEVTVERFIAEDSNGRTAETNPLNISQQASKGKVFKISTDSKGKLTKIEVAEDSKPVSGSGFKLDASYAEGFKLQSNTTIFWNAENGTDFGKYKVTTLEKAKKDFNKVVTGNIYVDKSGKVVAIVATTTDVDDDTTFVTGVVTDVRETSKDIYVTLEVNGSKKEYKGKNDVAGNTLAVEDTVIDLEVTEEGVIKKIEDTVDEEIVLTENATGSRIVSGAKNLVVEGRYYEKGLGKKTTATDFKTGVKAKVYYRNNSDKFVQVVEFIATKAEVDAENAAQAAADLQTAKAAVEGKTFTGLKITGGAAGTDADKKAAVQTVVNTVILPTGVTAVVSANGSTVTLSKTGATDVVVTTGATFVITDLEQANADITADLAAATAVLNGATDVATSLTLGTATNGSTITWESDNTAILTNAGAGQVGAGGTVTFTAKVNKTVNGKVGTEQTKAYTVIVNTDGTLKSVTAI